METSLIIAQHLEELSAPVLLQTVNPNSVDYNHFITLTDDELDRQPFGVITVNAKGEILFYNEWESRFSGLPRYLVLKRNFFEEIAPCTRVPAFAGRFQEYVRNQRSASLVAFDYVFTFKEFEYVKIVFAPARNADAVNLLVFKQSYERFKSPSELYNTLELKALSAMSKEELNMMSYGVITLDHEDTVVAFNDWEARLAGIPRYKVMHKNFFKEVAPCTRVDEFEGRYRAYKKGNAGSETFDFVFPFSRGAQFVKCLFLPGRESKSINLVVFKRKLLL